MNHIEQAKELIKRVRAARRALREHDRYVFTEDEVLFRYNSIIGMLIMAINDIDRMIDCWQETDDEKAR